MNKSEYQECPFCAEKIKYGALKCRHCHSLINNEKRIVSGYDISKQNMNYKKPPFSNLKIIVITAFIIILISLGVILAMRALNIDSDTSERIRVDKNLFNVTVTLPATMFESQEIENVISDAKQKGVKEIVVNSDGSLTYTMSRTTHKEIMEELSNGFIEAIEDMKSSGDFMSIKDITYNKDFTQFTLLVDKEVFENSFDGLVIIGIGILSMFYQIFDGIESDNCKATIYFEDINTGKVFDTFIYPDDFGE